jgi:polyferredoxin/uncharacterized protein with FMN-binding domain
MVKNVSKVQIFRIIVQIIFLVFFPALFVLTFNSLKQIYLMLLSGHFSLTKLLPYLAEALAIIPLTIFIGRFFCGWLCAFGAVNDFIYLIAKKIFKTKFYINEKADLVLKYLKYGILIFVIASLWSTGSHIYYAYSPWNAFAQISTLPESISQYAAGFTILALILVGAIFIERFFCRYLCPLGAVFTIISKIRILKIDKPTTKCGKCRICTNNCPMGIPLFNVAKVKSGECIDCFKCIHVCPAKNPHLTIANENIPPALASAIAISAFVAVYSAGNVLNSTLVSAASKNITSNKQSNTTSSSLENQTSSDGNKIATNIIAVNPQKNKTNTSVENNTTATENKSSSPTINNTSSKHTATPAKSNKHTKSITSSKTATASASTSKTTKKSTNSVTTNNTSTENTNSHVQRKYKDGTYTGEGFGYRPGLQVAVTIKDDKITNIEIVSNNETPDFAMMPFEIVPQEIIQSQSTDVDAVSGATRSSNGIMMAVKNALIQAQI